MNFTEPFLKSATYPNGSIALSGIFANLLVVDPEDKEVANIGYAAVDEMKKVGAEVVDINIPGLLELMHDDFDGMYFILSDVRADINAYLEAHPSAPVSSVADILKSDLLKDTDLRSNFQAAVDFKPGATLEFLTLNAKRQTIKRAVYVAMAEAQVDVLISPTLRRKPALMVNPNSAQIVMFVGIPVSPRLPLTTPAL